LGFKGFFRRIGWVWAGWLDWCGSGWVSMVQVYLFFWNTTVVTHGWLISQSVPWISAVLLSDWMERIARLDLAGQINIKYYLWYMCVLCVPILRNSKVWTRNVPAIYAYSRPWDVIEIRVELISNDTDLANMFDYKFSENHQNVL
jgi:hypothetical protein